MENKKNKNIEKNKQINKFKVIKNTSKIQNKTNKKNKKRNKDIVNNDIEKDLELCDKTISYLEAELDQIVNETQVKEIGDSIKNIKSTKQNIKNTRQSMNIYEKENIFNKMSIVGMDNKNSINPTKLENKNDINLNIRPVSK